MNEIITRPIQAVPAQTGGQTPAMPSMVLKDHLRSHLIHRRPLKGLSDFFDAMRSLSAYNSSVCMAEAIELNKQLPDEHEVERQLTEIRQAFAEKITRANIARITAAMCDAIPTFDAMKSPGYLDALLFVLEAENAIERFSPSALAGAAYRLLRSERFAPEPDKLVDAIRDEQKRLRTRGSVLIILQEKRSELQTAVEAIDAERVA